MSQDANPVEELQKEVQASLTNKITLLKEKIAKGETPTREEKVKVAVLADSPTVVTGFGNVCREILSMLHETGMYDFEVVGINYDGSPHDLPYKIYPAYNGLIPDPAYRDVFGRQRYLDLLGEGRFDIAWVLQDTFVVENLGQKIAETNNALPPENKFRFIYYFPIDAIPKKSWLDGSVLSAHHPVVYTNFGYNEVMKVYTVDEKSKLEEAEQKENLEKRAQLEASMNIIYHGVNTKDFYPIEDAEKIKELRQKFWGAKADKFVFINVNRNQPRKDMFRSMLAFKKLIERRRAKGLDDAYLYLHCNIFDSTLHLIDMGKQIELVEGDEYAFPDPKIFGVSSGWPISVLNQLYNAADAVITTTLGEGWGLSITEAMATKKPIIAPNHTSIPEILGKLGTSDTCERGILVKTRQGFVQHDDNSRIRPLTDEDDLAEKMEWLMENREVAQSLVERAYQWVQELQWRGDIVGKKWLDIFETAYELVLVNRAQAFDAVLAQKLKGDDLGRNEICPICQIKYKKCRHYEPQKS